MSSLGLHRSSNVKNGRFLTAIAENPPISTFCGGNRHLCNSTLECCCRSCPRGSFHTPLCSVSPIPPRCTFTVTSTRHISSFSLKQWQLTFCDPNHNLDPICEVPVDRLLSIHRKNGKGSTAVRDYSAAFDVEGTVVRDKAWVRTPSARSKKHTLTDNGKKAKITLISNDEEYLIDCISSEPSPRSDHGDRVAQEELEEEQYLYSVVHQCTNGYQRPSVWWEQQRKAVDQYNKNRLTEWVEQAKFSVGLRAGEARGRHPPLRLLKGMTFQDRCISILSLITEAANRTWRLEERKFRAITVADGKMFSHKEGQSGTEKQLPSKAQRKRAFTAPWLRMREAVMASIRQEIALCMSFRLSTLYEESGEERRTCSLLLSEGAPSQNSQHKAVQRTAACTISPELLRASLNDPTCCRFISDLKTSVSQLRLFAEN